MATPLSLQAEPIVPGYLIEKTIGQGTYGKVKLAISEASGQKVAIKCIEKSQLQSPKQVARLQREIRFLKLLHHPHIVKVYDVKETETAIYIIMEYAPGGELFDYIVANKRVKEKEARNLFRMVLSAVNYCHKNAVIHRDLKPENLLLDNNKCIKIIDFGFGNNFWTDGLLDTFCGSPFYASPEMILGKKYEGPEVDMWSLGVILFALLCGHLPFDDDNMKELYRKIAAGQYNCPDYLMPGARHLISRLITVDPKKRATLDEAISHPWVNEGYAALPHNYLPIRPHISDLGELDVDIVQRLAAFNFNENEVRSAFLEGDQARPHPIRATYFLLLEMLEREQRKVLEATQKAGLSPQPASFDKVFGQSDTGSPANPALISVGVIAEKLKGTHFSVIDKRGFASLKALNVGSSENIHGPNACGSLQSVAEPPRAKTVDRSSIGHKGPASNLDDSLQDPSSDHGQRNRPLSMMPPPPLAVPEDVETHRRHSTNNLSFAPVRRPSSSKSIKEELRAVSGWFLNVSTTSTKQPHEVLEEICRVLTANKLSYTFEGAFILNCEADVTALLGNESSDGKKARVLFQMELCSVPKMNLVGLHFRRVEGGVWNYKKISQKLLAQMAL